MAEHMRCDMLFDSGESSITVNHKTDGLIRQFLLSFIDKKIPTGRNVRFKGALICCQGRNDLAIPKLQNTFFRALPIDQYSVVL